MEQVVFEIFGRRRERGIQVRTSRSFSITLTPERLPILPVLELIYLGRAGISRIEILLQGLREYIREKCTSVQNDLEPYDRFVSSLEPNATVVSFNWDVLLELSILKARKSFQYLPTTTSGSDTLILKPHGSINWFALLDRELLSIDTTSNVGIIGPSLSYLLLYLKDPLGPVDMGSSSPFAKSPISRCQR